MRSRSLIFLLIGIFGLLAAGAVFVIPRLVTVPLPATEASVTSEDLATKIAAYEELVQEDPANPRYLTALGSLYVRQRDWSKAAESLQKALELKPEDNQIRQELGIILWHLGRQEEGLKYLDEAIQKDPKSAVAYFYLGMILAGTPGKKTEAIAALEKVIALSGDGELAAQARQMLVELKAKAGEPTAAPVETSSANMFLPKSLADLVLKDFYGGERAQKEIERLHGGKVTVKSGYVGYYSDSRHSATFWISEAQGEEATVLLERMKDGIAKGGTPFSAPQKASIPGLEAITVYFTTGMGQVHYFWVKKNLVIWVALEGFSSEAQLEFIKQAIIFVG